MYRTLTLTALCVALASTGCSKKMQLTVINHTDLARPVQLTVPHETMSVGTVGPGGGRLSTTVSVKEDDLPAQANLSAGTATSSFVISKHSPDAWWFHITADGKLAGPYGEDDVHVEAGVDTEVNVQGGSRMIVR